MDRREAAAAPSKPFRLPIQPLRLPKSWQHPRRMEEPMAHSCIRRSPGCFVPPNPPCMSWPRKRQSRCFFPGFLLTQEGHCVGSCFRRKDTGAAHKGPGLLLTQEGHRGAGRRYGTLSRPACGSLAVAALAGLYHQGRGDFDSFGEIVTKMANVAFRKPLCCLRWGWGPGGFLAEPGCMNNLSLSGAEADHRPPRFDPPSDSAHAH